MKMFALSFFLLTSASALACENGIFEGDLSIVRENLSKRLHCPHGEVLVPSALTLRTARCLGARPQVTLTVSGFDYNIISVEEDFIRGSRPNRHKLKLTFTAAERKHPITCYAPLNR